MKTFINLGLIAFTALAAVKDGHGRDWNFSKDTTYEQPTQGLADSLRLVNTTSDTLRFDSIGIEALRPAGMDTLRVSFQQTGANHYLVRRNGVVSPSTQQSKLVVLPNQSLRLNGFTIEGGFTPVAKRAVPSVGDSLTVRLIFMASAGRGRDTLTVIGRQNAPGSSSLKGLAGSSAPGMHLIWREGEGIRLRDAQGRTYNLRGKRLPEPAR